MAAQLQVVVREDEDDDDEGEPSKSSLFELPFAVATILEFQQRAYINSAGRPEWLWSRICAFVGFTHQPWRVLKVALPKIKRHMQRLHVDVAELRYNEAKKLQPHRQWKDHTCESRAFLAILLYVCQSRPVKGTCKQQALRLFLGIIEGAWRAVAPEKREKVYFQATLVTRDGRLVHEEVEVTQMGFLLGWDTLLSQSPAATVAWNRLRAHCWLGRCVSTTLQQPSLSDLGFFLAYTMAHPSLMIRGQQILPAIGLLLLQPFLEMCGGWVDQWAATLANKEAEQLPVLRNKVGNALKGMDVVNRMLMLRAVQREKLHRRRTMLTHPELLPLDSVWLRREAYLDVVLHARALANCMAHEPLQISVSWDPGSYGGKSVCAAVAYMPTMDVAAYLLSQTVAKVAVTDVDAELIQRAKQRKLTRVDGYAELRGLAAALQHSLNISLTDFEVPKGLLWKCLGVDEVRLKTPEGRFVRVDRVTREVRPEIPAGLDLSKVPLLLSCSDQGPCNMPPLNFLQYSDTPHMVLAIFDIYHRCWNDVKGACRKSSFGAWRNILEYTTIMNLNYGPFGSGAFFYKKQAQLQEMLQTQSIDSDVWSRYEHLICAERKIRVPTEPSERMQLFKSLAVLPNVVQKGPLTKLMRWFSWFESCAFYEGDFYALRLVLQNQSQCDSEGGEPEPMESDQKPGAKKDPREELQQLKKRKGSFKLAASLITEGSLLKKDVINSVCRATWKWHAKMQRDYKSPHDVAHMKVSCAADGFWKEELSEIVLCSLWRHDTMQHLLNSRGFDNAQTDEALTWQTELFTHLLEARTQSLCSFNCLPPHRYCHALSINPDVALQARQEAIRDFQALLAAEQAAALRVEVMPLDLRFWARNPVARLIFMAHEMDEQFNTFHAFNLHYASTVSIGDSRIIENIHQHGRDLLRGSKTETGYGDTAIMANILKSGCLNERKVKTVMANNAEKVQSESCFIREAVAKKLTTQGFHLPKQIQAMMLPKGKKFGATWPSPVTFLFILLCLRDAVDFQFLRPGLYVHLQCEPELAFSLVASRVAYRSEVQPTALQSRCSGQVRLPSLANGN